MTHDQEEALEVADRVAVMNEGHDRAGRHARTKCTTGRRRSFVFNFLGNVNLFHGRIDNGTTYIQQTKTDHLVFVRPHSLEITRRSPGGANHFRATTKHINAAGPVVKVEAVTEWGAPVQVEMSQERFRELSLIKGEEVFVVPTELTVFPSGEPVSTANP